jgi:hypothetical protein
MATITTTWVIKRSKSLDEFVKLVPKSPSFKSGLDWTRRPRDAAQFARRADARNFVKHLGVDHFPHTHVLAAITD